MSALAGHACVVHDAFDEDDVGCVGMRMMSAALRNEPKLVGAFCELCFANLEIVELKN